MRSTIAKQRVNYLRSIRIILNKRRKHMHITHAVSYLGAWDKLNNNRKSELSDIVIAADEYWRTRLTNSGSSRREPQSRPRQIWDETLSALGWDPNDRPFRAPSGKRVALSSLGPIKNGIAAQMMLGSPTWMHRWLFSQGALAVRFALVEIPVLVAPMREFVRLNERGAASASILSSFEYLREQLETLAPLSSNFPFLILGINAQQTILQPEVLELANDPNVTNERIVIDRSIEFPPEYHQAGLGILNYFGTFLRENYPNREAKVRIEQIGLRVRMVVETTDGNAEVVEKALQDYELVISGRAAPEAITNNDKVILDLRNELRMAQFRLESQRDIIDVQNRRIDKLMDSIGASLLASHSRPLSIQVNPSFHNSNTVTTNPDITQALNDIYELIDTLSPLEEAHTILNDLAGSLEVIESENDPEKLKESPGMTKLGRVLRRFATGTESLTNAIAGIERGQQLIGSLGHSYNHLASLCGLPIIPFA